MQSFQTFNKDQTSCCDFLLPPAGRFQYNPFAPRLKSTLSNCDVKAKALNPAQVEVLRYY